MKEPSWLKWFSWRPPAQQRPVGPGVYSVGVCWQLVYRNGELVDDGDGGPPHFASQEKAAQRASQYAIPDLGVPRPVRRLADCWLVTALCGTTFDEDNVCAMHHDSPDEARAMAIASGWVQLPSGMFLCSKECAACQVAA